MDDLNLKITVRNARLLRAIRDKFGTATELARQSGLRAQQVSKLVVMRRAPFRASGELTPIAATVCSALGMDPEELWPAHIARLKATRATVEVSMSVEQFAALADNDTERTIMYRQAIARWGAKLTTRERTALAAFAVGATAEEIAAEIGVTSRSRAHQIAAVAARKMRAAAYRDRVKCMAHLTVSDFKQEARG